MNRVYFYYYDLRGIFFMAKDKKSFLLYCDQQGVFNKLPDEIAGKLIKHIFAYVNDENPPCDDLLLTIAFEPIKTQLKRDLRKYDDYIDKQKFNGAKGGRPKKDETTQITQHIFLSNNMIKNELLFIFNYNWNVCGFRRYIISFRR